MADKIRGITIEIGGDTSGLTKSLKGLNKEIKSTQSQLKDVDKLLKLDPTNIDLLRQREKLLNDEVEQTSTKLGELKKLQKTMDENGVDKNSEQYMALQREIIATEQELGNLKDAARDSNATLSQIGAVADNVADKADKMASATKVVSTAAAAGLAAITAAAYDVITASDDLNTWSKQSGFSTEQIQQFQYAADRMDVSLETVIASARKLKKSMTSTSKETQAAFKTLGVSVTNADGTVRDSQTVFWECVAALGAIEDETERDVLAMQIFGKSADDLAGLIDDGGKSFEELAAEAKELGLVLDQETLDGLNAMNDELDKLKIMFKTTFAKVGAKLALKLAPIFDKIAAKVENLANWIANLSDDQIMGFAKALAALAALSPVLSFVSKMAKGVSTLTKAFKVIKPAITAFNAVLAANPIILIIAAIAALVYACVKFKDQICGAIDKVTKWLHDKLEKDWTEVFGPVLGGVLNVFSKGFLKVWDKFSSTVKTTVSLIHDIFTGDWEGAWNTCSKAVRSGISKAQGKLEQFDGFMNRTFTTDWRDKFGDRLGGWMNKASESILNAWNGEGGLKAKLNTALDWLDDTFSGDWGHAWTNIKMLGTNVWGSIKNGWEQTLKPKLEKANDWMTNTFGIDFGKTWTNIKMFGTNAWGAIKNGWETNLKPKLEGSQSWMDGTFKENWKKSWNAIKKVGSNAWTAIKDGWNGEDGLKSKLSSAMAWLGKMFVDPWRESWSNIKSLATGVWDKISGGWDTLKAALESAKKWLVDTFTVDWSEIWTNISGVFSSVWDGLKDAVKSPINAIIGYMNSLIDGINSVIEKVNNLSKLGGIWGGLEIGKVGKIPELAVGGTVVNGSAIVGEAGAELLTVTNGVAKVTPLNGNGASASAGNVTIYTQQLTEAQLDYLLARVNRGLGVMA